MKVTKSKQLTLHLGSYDKRCATQLHIEHDGMVLVKCLLLCDHEGVEHEEHILITSINVECNDAIFKKLVYNILDHILLYVKVTHTPVVVAFNNWWWSTCENSEMTCK